MKKNIIILFSIFLCSVLFAEKKLEDVISADYIDNLKKFGKVVIIHPVEDKNLSAVPNSDYRERILNERIEKGAKNIPFTAEYLYYIKKSDLVKNSKTGKTEFSIKDFSVVFRSISKMKGMKYHEDKGKGEILYKESYNIENENSNTPIPDFIEGSADGLVTYCYQKDHTYGDTKYKLSYYEKEDELYVTFLNKLPFGLMGVYPCEKDNLKMNILAIDCGESFLIYMNVDTNNKKVALFNIRKQMEESMSDRLDAIYKWCLKFY